MTAPTWPAFQNPDPPGQSGQAIKPLTGPALTAAMMQGALALRGVQAMVVPSWDGPQLASYLCTLPLGGDPQRVERLAGALASAARVASVRVSHWGGDLLIEVPKRKEDRKVLAAGRLDQEAAFEKAPARTAVPIGITTGGALAWLDLYDDRTCHLVIGGITGSGKTLALHWLLYRLIMQNHPKDLRLLAIDPKARALQPFAHVPHLLHPVVSRPVDAARLLSWAEAELDRRLAGARTSPRILVVVEEVADLVKVNPDTGRPLARIAQIGRDLGLHLVATAQQPGAKSLGESLINFPARLIGRVGSVTLALGAAGQARSYAHQLLGNGDFLLVAGGEDLVRLQVPLITGQQLGRMPHVAEPASLEDELPAAVEFADLLRDPRGGRGRRELSPAEYERLAADVDAGASAEQVRRDYRIGYTRAARIVGETRGQDGRA